MSQEELLAYAKKSKRFPGIDGVLSEDPEAATLSQRVTDHHETRTEIPNSLRPPEAGGNDDPSLSSPWLMTDLSSSIPKPDYITNINCERSGWCFVHEGHGAVPPEDSPLQTELLLLALTSEVNQEPLDLTPLPVDMTQRFTSVLLHEKQRLFYVGPIIISLLLAIAYICLPCHVPTDNYLFLFTNRALVNVSASISHVSMTLIFLNKVITVPEMVFILVIDNILALVVYTDLVVHHRNLGRDFVCWKLWIFIYGDGVLCLGLAMRECHCVLLQFSGAVFTYYIFLTVIESVWLKIFDVGADFNLIVMFFVWCTLCQRVLQSLSRRIAIGIAQVEGHPVQWYDLLRSQCFLFRAYTFSGIPMSVWMDIHYLDFFLKKVADISALVIFVARCLICRYASWVSDCYTPRKWTSKLFLELLLVLSGLLFVSEMASGLVSMYYFRGIRRTFVIRAVLSSKQLRVLLCVCVIATSCAVTFDEALQYVKFGKK